MSYIKPQALVFEEFNTVPSEIAEPLRAHISGGHAFLLRYGQAAEKAAATLGLYDPTAGVVGSWPGRPVGAVIDVAYTKVFIDGALMPYYVDAIGLGSAVVPLGVAAPDRIVASDVSGGFQGNGSANPRYAALLGRDAAPGDSVRVHGVVNSVDYTLDTYIRALESSGASRVIAAIKAPTLDPVDPASQVASATAVAGVGNTSNATVTASAVLYKPYAVGLVADAYTLTVVNAQVGTDPTTATFRVASGSGLDDVVSVAVGVDGAPFSVGALGLTVTVTKNASTPQPLVAGQSWVVSAAAAHVRPTPVSAGTYAGVDAITYIVEVTRGGYFAAATDGGRPAITATTSTGIDASGPTTIAAAATAVPIGTRGVTFAAGAVGAPPGLRKGDRFYVAATPSADGAFRTIALGHNLPPALLAATDLDLRLSIRRNLQLPAGRAGLPGIVNWTQSPTQITIAPGATGVDPSYTSSGSPTPLSIVGGTVYVEYRAWRSELVAQVGTIQDPGLLDTTIVGPLHPDNPLKWGVYKAMANANGTAVKFTGVADPASLNAWIDALQPLVGREDVYNLVPLSQAPEVLALYAAHTVAESGPEEGRWRAMFASPVLVTTAARVWASTSTDLGVVLATLTDDPAATGPQHTILTVPAVNANFLTNGVLPGDTARYFYTTANGVDVWTEYAIDAVLNESTLRLAVGAGAASATARKLEVWHPMSKNEQATDIGRRAGVYGSTRVVAVWPDQVGSGGVVYPGYFLACGLAGLASGVVPHQGMTHLEVAGFDDVTRASTYFNGSQLDTMAGSGTCVVTQDPDGKIYVRDCVTTLNTDINRSQEMVRRNVDSMAMLFLRRIRPFIGVANVTKSAINSIYIELVSAIEFLKANGFTETLGSQLIDGVVLELRPHSQLADRIVGVVGLTIPRELKNVECHLVV